jgi:hypothetical protein
MHTCHILFSYSLLQIFILPYNQFHICQPSFRLRTFTILNILASFFSPMKFTRKMMIYQVDTMNINVVLKSKYVTFKLGNMTNYDFRCGYNTDLVRKLTSFSAITFFFLSNIMLDSIVHDTSTVSHVPFYSVLLSVDCQSKV